MSHREGLPRLVVGTANSGKLLEITALLADLPVHVCSLADGPSVAFPEEGAEYAANAIAKARTVADQLGEYAIADDSGLEVDALGGRPGPLSARYGGAGLDASGRVTHLLAELSSEMDRRARFVCVAAFADPRGGVAIAEGICPGVILDAPRGIGGFGYDPVFRPDGFEQAMAELASSAKDEISHRGLAVRALLPRIRAVLGLSPSDSRCGLRAGAVSDVQVFGPLVDELPDE